MSHPQPETPPRERPHLCGRCVVNETPPGVVYCDECLDALEICPNCDGPSPDWGLCRDCRKALDCVD